VDPVGIFRVKEDYADGLYVVLRNCLKKNNRDDWKGFGLANDNSVIMHKGEKKKKCGEKSIFWLIP
jgi:hypothetical protein